MIHQANRVNRVVPVLIAGGLLIAGCASDHAAKSRMATKMENAPRVGMTRGEVIARYGETNNIRVGADGETWVYNLDADGTFIPWNVGYRPRLRIIAFDGDGKVKSWSDSE